MLVECYKLYTGTHPVIIGGSRIVVKVDENVLSGRGTTRNPASVDDTRDIVWIIGGIIWTNKRIFFVVRVVDCTVRSLQETIGPFIGSGRLYTPVLDQVGYTPRKKKD